MAIAVQSPRDARAPKDEREHLIDLKATRTAFYVLFGGALLSIFTMHFRVNVWTLSQFVLFSIVVAELVKFASQIVLFRRGLLTWVAARFATRIRDLRFNQARDDAAGARRSHRRHAPDGQRHRAREVLARRSRSRFRSRRCSTCRSIRSSSTRKQRGEAMMDFFRYDFDYAWPWTYGHLIAAIVFAALGGVAYWLRWTRLTIVAGVLALWGLCGAYHHPRPASFQPPGRAANRTIPAVWIRPRARRRRGLGAIDVDGAALQTARDGRRARSIHRLLRHRRQHTGSTASECAGGRC